MNLEERLAAVIEKISAATQEELPRLALELKALDLLARVQSKNPVAKNQAKHPAVSKVHGS